MAKKLDFDKLQAVQDSAPLSQNEEQEESKNLLLKYPKSWDQRIKKRPDKMSLNQFIRTAIAEKMEREGI